MVTKNKRFHKCVIGVGGEINTMKKFPWEAVFEASKEPLRLLLLAVIPIGLAYVKTIPYEWAGVLIVLLRLTDSVLHEVGKEKKSEFLIKGLTQF